MSKNKPVEFIGYSQNTIDEAFQNALHQAKEHEYVDVIETSGSYIKGHKKHYQVTLTKSKVY